VASVAEVHAEVPVLHYVHEVPPANKT